MAITAKQVQELRQKTGLGIMECKKALGETDGDLEKAVEELRKRAMIKSEKKADRATAEGVVAHYIHGGKVGVLLELQCETDFVANTDNFQNVGKDIAMHIAAMNPPYLNRDQVPEDTIAKEREIAAEQVKGKPENIVDKIVDGKIDKFFAENCLLEQKYIKDDSKTINDLLKETIAQVGENVQIGKFSRIQVGA